MSRTQSGGGPDRLCCARARYCAHTPIFGIALFLFLFTQPLFAKYSGGEGTPEAPYRISDHNDLYALADDVNDYNKCFVMTADIDLDPCLPGRRSLTTALIAPDVETNNGSTFDGTPFVGTFDGNDFQLINLTIATTAPTNEYLGLFGKTDANAVISNLGVTDVNITGGAGSYYLGALVGYNWDGSITNSYATGTVSGDYYVGGLTGASTNGNINECYVTGAILGGWNASYIGGLSGLNSYGTINDCYATGSVEGTNASDYLGGLVGYSIYGTVIASFATCDVSAADNSRYVGGLVGYNRDDGAITDCYATGAISGGEDYTGGLVGHNDYGGTITASHATGEVRAGDHVGGLVGNNGYNGAVRDCYATGSVSGGIRVGGLVGMNHSKGTVTNCYATGSVAGGRVGGLVGENFGPITGCYALGDVNGGSVGGLVGDSSGEISACYSTGTVSGVGSLGGLIGDAYPFEAVTSMSFWDVESSGRSGSSGGKGLTTQQMKTMSIFQNAGWADSGWVMQDGQDYPRLAWENTGGVPIPAAEPVPLPGAGSEADPYQVWTAQDFALLSWHGSILDKHIVLMNDVNVAEVSLYPIGDLGPFVGAFNGNGHVIRKAVVDFPTSDCVGLFGYLDHGGRIANLGIEEVNVTGDEYVGGLAGWDSNGTISECHASGTVTGVRYLGGLVGYNAYDSTIKDCYATGVVSGGGYAGGLAGCTDFYSVTVNCYATGAVSGQACVGGLVGNSSGAIAGCSAAGAVSGTGGFVGGLVGRNYSTIANCFATGAVSSDGSHVGALVGYNEYASATDCYATGDVDGADSVAGLVGENYRGKVIHCYSTGKPTGTSNVGGLVGTKTTGSDYEDTGNFWDTETSETPTSAMGTGKTTQEMQDANTFVSAGWDFNDVWAICEGTNYPRLLWSIPWADIICPDGVTFVDYSYLAEHYLWTDYGDVNGVEMTGDGKIDAEEFAILANWWGQTSCGDCGGADFTGEGNVDIDDLAVLCGYWLSTDYGDCEGAELTGDGLVDTADVKALTEQWLEGI